MQQTAPTSPAPRTWLQVHRESRDMTQRALGLRAGVSVGMICKIERGQRKPSDALAKKLAKALSMKVDEVFPSAGPTPGQWLEMIRAGEATK